MRKALLLLALALAGCKSGRSDARLEERQREQEKEIIELKARVRLLQDQVRGLEMRSGDPPDHFSSPDTGVAVPSGSPITSRCRPRKAEHDFEIDHSGSFDPGALAREVRVVPNVQDGKVHGMKLFGIRSDSLLGSCGFLNGDVVLSVNNLALDDPDHALEAYSLAKTATEFDFALLRRGEPATVTVHLRSP